MGAGKTKTAIDIARSIYLRHDRLLKTLIICPIVVVENWKREFLTHSNVPAAAIQVVDGKSKPNGKKVKTAQLKLKLEQLNNSSASIFIINTESVGNKNLWPLIESMGFEVLIVDESHRFKSPSATRTKALHRLTNQGQLEYRYILTGSPILQDALDLWSQFFILSPSILGYNYFSFRSQYFYDANASMPAHVHFPKFIPKDEAYYKKLKLPYNDDFATLNKIIYRHASRVMKDDVLDLPPFVTQKIEVEFTKEQERIYEEMRKDLVATLDTSEELYTFEHNNFLDIAEAEVMSADLAIVKTLRLMQIAAGIFTNEDGDVKEIKENRSKILKELLEL
jgi:SNF2 family DNA or RNA helicase